MASDIPENIKDELSRLAGERFEAAVRWCNGDPHPLAENRKNKSECAQLWEHHVDGVQLAIMELLEGTGLTAEFGAGLRPCLKTAKGVFVNIP